MEVVEEPNTDTIEECYLELLKVNPDPVKPQECCRCSTQIEQYQQVFDCDTCAHSVCVACRFKDNLPCKLCNVINKETVTMPTKSNDLFVKHRMKKHLNIDHIVDVEVTTTEGVFVKQMCTVCKRVFKKSNARYHYTCASDEKPFSCVECGQKFIKKSHMESHLNNHFGIKPFKCNVRTCNASFTQKDKLTRHLKSHNKDDKFTCSICQKEYTTQAILSVHIKKVHNSTTKSFQCEMCPRSYKYKQSLHVHMLKHQALREYMCEVCGKKYPLMAQLKHHKRSHMVYHRRPYKCRCGWRFISRHDRARHRLIHSTSRDFECSLCKTTFGRKDNLERHMKNFHQEDPPLFLNGKPTATVAPFNKKLSKSKNETRFNKEIASTNKQAKLNLIKKQTKKKKNVLLGNKILGVVQTNEETSVTSNPEQLMNECQNKISLNEQSKDSPHTLSVIVSPKTNENQNRASVIKNVPKLLPYRVLPPDKRFLKMTEEITKGKSPSELMPPPVGNGSRPKTNLATVQMSTRTQNRDPQRSNPVSPIRTETPVSKPISKEKPTQGQRRKIPKDDALNRCFRIICHTSSLKSNATPLPKTLPESSNQFVIINPGEQIKRTSASLTSTTERLVNTPIAEIGISTFTNCSYVNGKLTGSATPFTVLNDTIGIDPGCTKPIGGPTLPSTVSDTSCDDGMQEDSFPNTYTHLTDVPSCTSYTPYFESECFKDNENGYYEGNVDNLLPNDLDIGFQYVDEQLDCAEMNFSSDSRNLPRYVSQEPITTRESFS